MLNRLGFDDDAVLGSVSSQGSKALWKEDCSQRSPRDKVRLCCHV